MLLAMTVKGGNLSPIPLPLGISEGKGDGVPDES